MGEIALYYGNCLDIMQEIPEASVDMVLCDLPYGKTRCRWDIPIAFDQLWEQYRRITKETAPIVLFGSEPFASLLRTSNLEWYRYDWIWDKIAGTGFLNAKRQPMRCHESICVFYRKQCRYYPIKTEGHDLKASRKRTDKTEVYGRQRKETVYASTSRYPRSIQRFSRDTQRLSLHPTQKPVALLEYLICTYTAEGETVLDNCMGSGSTGVACANTNRNFIGIELDRQYFEAAQRRIQEAQKQLGSIK